MRARPRDSTKQRANMRQPVLDRLPSYLRAVEQLARIGPNEAMNSVSLAEFIGVTAATLRSDLSYMAGLGKSGKGYEIGVVVAGIRRELGLDQIWNIAMIGSNTLGKGVIEYLRGGNGEFVVVGLFDPDPMRVGWRLGQHVTEPLTALGGAVVDRGISIGFVTLQGASVQQAVEALVDAGVGAIVNCSPEHASVPPDVRVITFDPLLALRTLTPGLVPISDIVKPEDRRDG